MTIVRIDNPDRSSVGWQARATTTGRQYLSRFFSDRKYGGKRKALAMAKAELPRLERRARKLR